MTWFKATLAAFVGAVFGLFGLWVFIKLEHHLFQQTMFAPEAVVISGVSLVSSGILGAMTGVILSSRSPYSKRVSSICIVGGLIAGLLSWWSLFLVIRAFEQVGGQAPTGTRLALQRFLSLEGLPFPILLGAVLIFWGMASISKEQAG